MSLDKTLKAIGLRKKTPADKVREAGANLNARFAKLRGATPASRARAAGARFGLDKRPVVLAALWIFAADPNSQKAERNHPYRKTRFLHLGYLTIPLKAHESARLC